MGTWQGLKSACKGLNPVVLGGRLLDLVFPRACAVCRRPLPAEEDAASRATGLCRACRAAFRAVEAPLCAVCGTPFPEGALSYEHWCGDCLARRPHYERARAALRFEGPLVDAVHAFKYRGRAELAEDLGPLLAEAAVRHFGLFRPCLVMPVPLHPGRLRERGFNQSRLLARHVARRLEAPLDDLALRRVRATASQTGLDRRARRRNVRRAFALATPAAVAGRPVLLIDDVLTTGHTLDECARVLIAGGATRVAALTLARAVPFR